MKWGTLAAFICSYFKFTTVCKLEDLKKHQAKSQLGANEKHNQNEFVTASSVRVCQMERGLGFTTNLSLRKANRKISIIVKYPEQEFAAKLPQSIGLRLAFGNILLYVLKSSQEYHTQSWTLNTQCQSHSPKKTNQVPLRLETKLPGLKKHLFPL